MISIPGRRAYKLRGYCKMQEYIIIITFVNPRSMYKDNIWYSRSRCVELVRSFDPRARASPHRYNISILRRRLNLTRMWNEGNRT